MTGGGETWVARLMPPPGRSVDELLRVPLGLDVWERHPDHLVVAASESQLGEIERRGLAEVERMMTRPQYEVRMSDGPCSTAGGTVDRTVPEGASTAALAAVPAAPTGVRAIAGDGFARVTWTDGAGAVTGHVVTASDGQVFHGGPETWAWATSLVNGQPYSFTVAARNSTGTGPASAPSVPVTPRAPAPGNRWARITRMTTDRERATAVRLRDGRVLVVGGHNPQDLTSAEIFHPATGTWTPANPVGARGSGFTLTTLPDGRVLRVGGYGAGQTPLASAELLNPGNGTWTSTPAMSTARAGHSAVLLADGDVLVAGGTTATSAGPSVVASAELYRPSTGQWTAVPPMATARTGHLAVRLLDERVVVAGGNDGSAGVTSAERYVPGGPGWEPTGAMTTVRQSDEVCCPAAALLPDGNVLVAGGSGPQGEVLSSAEVYDGGTWQVTGNLLFGRDAGFAMVPLLDGRVLVAGGRDDWGSLFCAELYDHVAGTWTRTNDMHHPRVFPAATLLADGRVMVAGGAQVGTSMSWVEVFSPV
ncbi:kelch repeat-containing protein [Pseudonocardia halophobica]|uniref:kelch repeat-containing protein n=1 Tax=Pseudonocardia halophobica TaxID=29401 RepID=UPI003D8D345C